jgi:hypothetical protein
MPQTETVPTANPALQAGDARSVQSMPRFLLIFTVILFCLRIAAFVTQPPQPSPSASSQPSGPQVEMETEVETGKSKP